MLTTIGQGSTMVRSICIVVDHSLTDKCHRWSWVDYFQSYGDNLYRSTHPLIHKNTIYLVTKDLWQDFESTTFKMTLDRLVKRPFVFERSFVYEKIIVNHYWKCFFLFAICDKVRLWSLKFSDNFWCLSMPERFGTNHHNCF